MDKNETKLNLKKVTISTLDGEEMKDLVGGASAKCSTWTIWDCNQTNSPSYCLPWLCQTFPC